GGGGYDVEMESEEESDDDGFVEVD
nr:Chain B, Non-structural protein NS-S [Rift valley fever virus (STRAIN ZH-548 M12)]